MKIILISIRNFSTTYKIYLAAVCFRKSLEYKIVIRTDKAELLLKQIGFDISKKPVIYAGGLNQEFYVGILNDLVNTYLSRGTYNVLYFDYHLNFTERELYLEKANEVCRTYANGILKLIDAGLPANSIELVGVSFGARFITLVGNYTHSKLGLLVGLDPEIEPMNFKFNKAYALYTIAVWTSHGLGLDLEVNGHAHYMVNNGTAVQPGCPLTEASMICSHARAVFIWINMIRYPELFFGLLCNETVCDRDRIAQLGPETRLYGRYYFKRKTEPPFGYGIDGAGR